MDSCSRAQVSVPGTQLRTVRPSRRHKDSNFSLSIQGGDAENSPLEDTKPSAAYDAGQDQPCLGAPLRFGRRESSAPPLDTLRVDELEPRPAARVRSEL